MSRPILSFTLIFFLAPAAALAAPPVAPPASPATWGVDVSGTGACARDGNFAASLSAQVPDAKRPGPGALPELVASVRLESAQHASVHVIDGASARELGAREIALSGRGCANAAETIGFVLGVLFQTDHGFAEEPLPEPEPEPPPEPPARPAEPPAPPPRRVINERYAWLGPRPAHELTVSGGVHRGLMPGFPLGGRFSWTIVAARAWPTTLWITGWGNSYTKVAQTTFGSAYGGVSTCPLYMHRERFRLRGCAGVGVGAAWAQAGRKDLYGTGKWREPLGLVGLHPSFAVRIVGPLYLDFTLQVDVPLARREYSYKIVTNERVPIYRTSWVVGSAFLGLSLRFR